MVSGRLKNVKAKLDHLRRIGIKHNICKPPVNTWVFPKIGVPQNGWFIMENPIKMDDLGVPPFSETPTCFKQLSRLDESLDEGTSRMLCGTGGSLSIGISGISLETRQGL